MKKNIPAACLLLMILIFSSCFKDNCRHTYKLFTPVYSKLTDLRAAVQSKGAAALTNIGKLYIQGSWIFLNEQGRGIHVIDNSNPVHPVKTAFINIPGNIDMAVKGNILYADLYCDLAAINISDPRNISVAKYLTNTFPEKSSNAGTSDPDSINVITGWNSRDTVMDCETANSCINCNLMYYAAPTQSNASVKAAAGVAGSMARFATVNDYMYAVSTTNLNIIDIHEAADPFFIQRKAIGWNIETIFPDNNKLYVGAGSSMSVFGLQNPADPEQLSSTTHWCSGDPVVTDNNYAYVTLHEANICGSTVNELEIYRLDAFSSPVLVKVYPLANPQGLSKDGNLLFICDEGLKIYDASDVRNITLIKHFPLVKTYDVITGNGIAYVVGKDGLFQYDYSNTKDIHFLSKLLK